MRNKNLGSKQYLEEGDEISLSFSFIEKQTHTYGLCFSVFNDISPLSSLRSFLMDLTYILPEGLVGCASKPQETNHCK